MNDRSSSRTLTVAVILFVIVILLYAWTYAAAPFNSTIDSVILNGMTTLAALLVAVILTRITFFYQRDEAPFVIWAAFALGMWMWALAEGCWGYLYATVGEVPLFSMADVFWLLGYIPLTISLARQFRLVLFKSRSTVIVTTVGIWLAVFITIGVILLVSHSQTPFDDFIRYIYVFADTTIGLAAAYLVYAFGGRALAIPWLTIGSFAVADFIYMQLTETGVYDWEMRGVSVALLADTLYVAAYLIVAWGTLRHYLLLKRSSALFQPETDPV
jgi:hypothetical protein